MRGNIVHVGYITGLLSRARASVITGSPEYLDELTPIGVRTVRIQYLVRGQARSRGKEKKKMGKLIMQIASLAQVAQLSFRLLRRRQHLPPRSPSVL